MKCFFLERVNDNDGNVDFWRRTDTGERFDRIADVPPGAMWYADWMLDPALGIKNDWKGPDGHCLVVRCPNGSDWPIDSKASNCTKKDDHVHKCWVRHGTPPNITVDKNGDTCAAGAGSILIDDYHGFLRSGEFKKA